MTQGETFIALLLAVIAYFLYQIAKQLSYLTGRRFKIGLPKLPTTSYKKDPSAGSGQDREESKLPN